MNYTKANLPILAVETQEKFLRRFPKSNLRESMLLQVSKTYEQLAKIDALGASFSASGLGDLAAVLRQHISAGEVVTGPGGPGAAPAPE